MPVTASGWPCEIILIIDNEFGFNMMFPTVVLTGAVSLPQNSRVPCAIVIGAEFRIRSLRAFPTPELSTAKVVPKFSVMPLTFGSAPAPASVTTPPA